MKSITSTAVAAIKHNYHVKDEILVIPNGPETVCVKLRNEGERQVQPGIEVQVAT